MEKTDIAYLSCRILAIYILFRALQHLSYLAAFYQGSFEPVIMVQMTLSVLVPFLVLAGFSAVLWIFAGRLVKYILPWKEEVDEKVLMINPKEIYALAFSIVGVIILAVAIPGVFQVISSMIMLYTQGFYMNQPLFKLQTTFSLIEKIVQFAIGFGLILGSRGLSIFLSKIREL